jgi:hypothetical protein
MVHIRRFHRGIGAPIKLEGKFYPREEIYHERDPSAAPRSSAYNGSQSSYPQYPSVPSIETHDNLDTFYNALLKVKRITEKIQRNEKLYNELLSDPFGKNHYQSQAQWLAPQFIVPQQQMVSPTFPVQSEFKTKKLYTYDSNADPWRDYILGFRGILCNSCLSGDILPIYYFPDPGIPYFCQHLCDPDIFRECSSTKLEFRSKMLQDQNSFLAYKLRGEYTKWSGNSPMLICKKIIIPDHMAGDSKKKSITVLGSVSENHWLLKNIREKVTAITQLDLTEFLYLSENNNVNAFEILFEEREELHGSYIISVTKKSTRSSSDGILNSSALL